MANVWFVKAVIDAVIAVTIASVIAENVFATFCDFWSAVSTLPNPWANLSTFCKVGASAVFFISWFSFATSFSVFITATCILLYSFAEMSPFANNWLASICFCFNKASFCVVSPTWFSNNFSFCVDASVFFGSNLKALSNSFVWFVANFIVSFNFLTFWSIASKLLPTSKSATSYFIFFWNRS